MSNHYSIFLIHVNQAVVRSMRHLASKRLRQNLDPTGSDHRSDHGSDQITDRVTDRITDRVMLIAIINFAPQAKIKSTLHNEAQEPLGVSLFLFLFFSSKNPMAVSRSVV